MIRRVLHAAIAGVERPLRRDFDTLAAEAERRLPEARALIRARFGEDLAWYASPEDEACVAVSLVLEEEEGWEGELEDDLWHLEGVLLRRQWEQERR